MDNTQIRLDKRPSEDNALTTEATGGTIVVGAGRRIDREGSKTTRFPRENELAVTRVVRSCLMQLRAKHVVSSAACGADMIIVETAHELGIPVVMVLPFPVESFKRYSVADCGGNWAERFDAIIEKQQRLGTVFELGPAPNSEVGETKGYRATTERLLVEAHALRAGSQLDIIGLIVWEKQRKSTGDETAALLDSVRRQKWRFVEVDTLVSSIL